MNRAISVTLTIVVCLAIIGIASCETPLRSAERTGDEWFTLVESLQRHEAKLDKDDRFFLRYMVNWLTVDSHVIPTKDQQDWLLDIKRRVDK